MMYVLWKWRMIIMIIDDNHFDQHHFLIWNMVAMIVVLVVVIQFSILVMMIIQVDNIVLQKKQFGLACLNLLQRDERKKINVH